MFSWPIVVEITKNAKNSCRYKECVLAITLQKRCVRTKVGSSGKWFRIELNRYYFACEIYMVGIVSFRSMLFFAFVWLDITLQAHAHTQRFNRRRQAYKQTQKRQQCFGWWFFFVQFVFVVILIWPAWIYRILMKNLKTHTNAKFNVAVTSVCISFISFLLLLVQYNDVAFCNFVYRTHRVLASLYSLLFIAIFYAFCINDHFYCISVFFACFVPNTNGDGNTHIMI